MTTWPIDRKVLDAIPEAAATGITPPAVGRGGNIHDAIRTHSQHRRVNEALALHASTVQRYHQNEEVEFPESSDSDEDEIADPAEIQPPPDYDTDAGSD